LTSIPTEPAGSNEISFTVRTHPLNGWLLARLEVGDRDVMMVLDTGSPVSSISQETYTRLLPTGFLVSAGGRFWMMRSLQLEEHPIAELRVHVSQRVTVVKAQGILGLDFLRRFEQVHFHVPTLRLTLAYPPGARLN